MNCRASLVGNLVGRLREDADGKMGLSHVGAAEMSVPPLVVLGVSPGLPRPVPHPPSLLNSPTRSLQIRRCLIMAGDIESGSDSVESVQLEF